ncbi:MAG: MarR family transcriptional regulator [Rhodospirillaceae bacterium]|jgi:DNA-binding MarR family transcriptional regulator|nr:MarR family transcriptional regulator [Rhodospirillaceae bacterium]MBT4490229.1 MarR family transcriptional regulator [Rhodospirillaceae bacterium]MBT5193894.1 MarR family transcriptional regulator [Rhodospirillaceae bacterium]MBT5898987.1 MarR family transcriptional regulator [Rhodospirillaceae bacterium]MBT6427092.1 MarR family transcriptional regulator [Rhodospirillaceae bacterium]
MPLEASLERPDKPELRLWLRLLTCTNLVEGEIRRRLRQDFATTLPRFDLLAQLDRHPDGLSLTGLSNRMMVSNGNLTGLVDRLEADGLVERRPDPNDGRSTRVALTRAGKSHFDAMTPAHEAWVNDLLDGLSTDEIQRLHDLLGKLKYSATEAAT